MILSSYRFAQLGLIGGLVIHSWFCTWMLPCAETLDTAMETENRCLRRVDTKNRRSLVGVNPRWDIFRGNFQRAPNFCRNLRCNSPVKCVEKYAIIGLGSSVTNDNWRNRQKRCRELHRFTVNAIRTVKRNTLHALENPEDSKLKYATCKWISFPFSQQ